jgi:hypothetical protein
VSAEIVLPRVAFDKLREGRTTIRLADSEGQSVFLFTKRGWPSARIPGPQPSVVLSTAALDLIGRPEGSAVTGTVGGTEWIVRVAS